MTGVSQISAVRPRHGWLVLIAMASMALFRGPLLALAHLAVEDERYTYIAFVPFITAFLIHFEGPEAFRHALPAKVTGSGIIALAVGLLCTAGVGTSTSGFATLFVSAAGFVTLWIGAFVLCYGTGVLKAAPFPFVFLLLFVPPPPAFLQALVVLLQKGSADVSYFFFKLAGVPVLRQGFVFSLPGLDVEVAQQCSGIRSGVSLFISAILAGHLTLHATWKKVFLSLVTVPVVIGKNALRIVVLSLAGVYVDRNILFSRIHKSSGLLFSPVAFFSLACLLFVLYQSEKKSTAAGKF